MLLFFTYVRVLSIIICHISIFIKLFLNEVLVSAIRQENSIIVKENGKFCYILRMCLSPEKSINYEKASYIIHS